MPASQVTMTTAAGIMEQEAAADGPQWELMEVMEGMEVIIIVMPLQMVLMALRLREERRVEQAEVRPLLIIVEQALAAIAMLPLTKGVPVLMAQMVAMALQEA